MNKKIIATTALAFALAAAIAPVSYAGGKEKCYGVSNAGQNDCGNLAGTHSCAGQAKVDSDPGEWKLVPKGSCLELGGLSKKAAKAKYQADNASTI